MAPVVTLRMPTDGFAKSWSHCQLLADFLARYASSNFFDSERYSSLLSCLLNELVEFVFRLHLPQRELTFDVFKRAEVVIVQLTIPADARQRESYRSHLQNLDEQTLRTSLQLPPAAEVDAHHGLIELATMYGLQINLSEQPDHEAVLLTVPVHFDQYGDAT